MPAGKYNIWLEKGAAYPLAFKYLDAANNPVPFTGKHGKLTLFDNSGMSLVSIASTLTDDGMISTRIGATVTAALSNKGGTYRVDLINDTDPDDVDRVLIGSWELQ